MIKVLFWGLVALDTAGLLLWFVLGLAAAGSTKDSPLAVAFFLLILPGIPLLLSVLLFVRGTSPVLRGLAFLLVAAPLLVAFGTKMYADARFAAHSNANGDLTFFRAGPSRDIVAAIRRNDAASVSALAPQVDVNAPGMDGMTLLVLALRQMRSTPEQHDVLRALLKAGADPNTGPQYELPLGMALQVVAKAGPEPVRLLLEAGANPNRKDGFGRPLFFGGVYDHVHPDVMQALIDHGADLNATGDKGERVLFAAADARNWRVAMMLLQRGVDWRLGQTLNGKSFAEMLEANASWASTDSGFADVMDFIKRR